jgi:type IV pilus assembly protein PilA
MKKENPMLTWTDRRTRQRGFSLVELLIVIAIILIIAAIAVPRLTRAQMFAKETAAIANLKTLHTAQTQYYSTYGKFATSLAELGPPTSGAPSPQASDLIQSDLASGTKGGFKYQMQGGPSGYTVSVTPNVFGTDGARTFYSDQTQVIRNHFGPEPATVNDKELN